MGKANNISFHQNDNEKNRFIT